MKSALLSVKRKSQASEHFFLQAINMYQWYSDIVCLFTVKSFAPLHSIALKSEEYLCH